MKVRIEFLVDEIKVKCLPGVTYDTICSELYGMSKKQGQILEMLDGSYINIYVKGENGRYTFYQALQREVYDMYVNIFKQYKLYF